MCEFCERSVEPKNPRVSLKEHFNFVQCLDMRAHKDDPGSNGFDSYDDILEVLSLSPMPERTLVRVTNGSYDLYFEIPNEAEQPFRKWLLDEFGCFPVKWDYPRCIQMP